MTGKTGVGISAICGTRQGKSRILGQGKAVESPSIAYYIETPFGLRFGLWSETGKFLRSVSEAEFSESCMDIPIYRASHSGMVLPAANRRQLPLIVEVEK